MAEPFLGQLMLVPYTFAPQGWLFCNGQLLPINQYQALYSLLNTTFGGNGSTTFGLPNLNGRVPVGAGQLAGGSNYALGSTGGVEQVQLNTSQLPAHNHSIVATGTNGNTYNPSGAYIAPVDTGGDAPANSFNTQLSSATLANCIGNTGGNGSHENRQPYQVLNYIICTNGIYPSRP